ncbi:hypothetical protein L210DRAFT_3653609 [Boletus edulis BED1]|uniref:Alpha-type protein kinase domain-containing protein n=1 Tax=Boletus edulis BED1 TaxID=1328754 RepID=A0AAD4G7P0_BOLED|nr:hypothetical protein L210DRAFT_3653609 [Boletus edulis BED1]
MSNPFDIKMVERFSGHIRVDANETTMLGVGAFKTAQAIELTLFPLRSSGIGCIASHSIAGKRPYLNPTGGIGRRPYIRFSMGDESRRLYREANVLYWAMALLDFSYEYIDQCIADAEEPPPFDIPRLRFVEAGLLFAYAADRADSTQGPGSKSGTVATTYLAEEIIDGDFFKYIHNGSASPRLFSDPMADDIAEFLAFTQHVQYNKTGGLVYVSDYQGSTTLLTDPQILTHPDVGDGLSLFGDGNVKKGVELFEEQHSCSTNKYCSWPGFNMAEFGSEGDSDL